MGRKEDLAMAIVDSEQFMWLMAGTTPERARMYLDDFREAFTAYRDLGGGYNPSRKWYESQRAAKKYDDKRTDDWEDRF